MPADTAPASAVRIPRGARIARAAIVASIANLGPLRRPFALAVGSVWYATRSPAQRRRTARNHHRLDPSLDLPAARRRAFRSHVEYVAMICDSIWAETLRSDQVRRVVRVEGGDRAGSGDAAVLVLAHFGNWDMAASAALAMGSRLTTVMAPIISPAFTAMVVLSRLEKGLELFTPQQAARGLVRALRRGRQVALMADVPEAGPTVVVPYCGGPVRVSAVPARLAAAVGVPLVPCACWRESTGWVLQIQEPLRVGRDDDERAVMAAVASALEPPVRAHPEQWYPFHEVYDR